MFKCTGLTRLPQVRRRPSVSTLQSASLKALFQVLLATLGGAGTQLVEMAI